jgi:hypothetical protein
MATKTGVRNQNQNVDQVDPIICDNDVIGDEGRNQTAVFTVMTQKELDMQSLPRNKRPRLMTYGAKKWARLFQKDEDGDSVLLNLLLWLREERNDFAELCGNIDDFIRQFRELKAELFDESPDDDDEQEEPQSDAVEAAYQAHMAGETEDVDADTEQPATPSLASQHLGQTAVWQTADEEQRQLISEHYDDYIARNGARKSYLASVTGYRTADLFIAAINRQQQAAAKADNISQDEALLAKVKSMLANQTKVWRTANVGEKEFLVQDCLASLKDGMTIEEYRNQLNKFTSVAAYVAAA